ncbi:MULTISPECIES: site-specific integrase [Streptomyces]|uniref:Site-specific integrase n=1 Tax=Streptomyces koelreuteriae TaxID=2838015 RepID=A0ABX8FWN4_9ACTN|nr:MULTISPECIES: site-specific integrase [Streptomyces]QWB25613.1 site-specific integrase [Streptomyces koelreuteriae]UUA08663.1 site-specific integrase [Streptomyces koelreuteriae]UUA16268.1 site-specific integrase [Streptomyces sp. CRCS-T-1]
MAQKRRHFGRVRKLPSGRYQARYLGPDGQLRPAPETFRTKRDADDWLADKQTELRRGDWHDPDAGKVPFGEYAAAWIKERELTTTTRQLYGSLLRHHLEPAFGGVNVAEISPPLVRRWRADKLAFGTGPTTVAKAYALLRAIMGTAVADQMIRRNPCTIKGASTVHTPERPTATVQEVYDLAEAMQPRYRALVLMAGFLGLRWGELIGLHRRDIDLDHGAVRVRRAVAELFNGQREIKAPKSAAGKRTVAIPAAIIPDILDHLERYAEPGADGRVFIGAKGATPRRNHFNRLWRKASADAGIKNLHFHDLRHTGNTLAASTGASTRELMSRMGHSTARAALIYQHASAERDRLIADALSALVDKGRKTKRKQDPERKGHARDTAD